MHDTFSPAGGSPLASVILPAYNAARYLPRCLDSLLAQTEKNFEVILVDDGSTDGTGEICDSRAARDRRVRVIHTENGGVSKARNKGLDAAGGKFVLFCDADDTVSPDWVGKLCGDGMTDADDMDMAVCGIKLVYPGAAPREVPTDWNGIGDCSLPLSAVWQLQERGLMLSPCNKSFRRSILETQSLRFDESMAYCEDEQFVLRYLLHADHGFRVVREDLYFYEKEHEGSLTHRYVPDLWNAIETSRVLREQLFAQAGVDTDAIHTSYCSFLNWRVQQALANLSVPGCPLSRRERAAEMRRILRSNTCREAFRDGNFGNTPGWYATVLKSRSAELLRTVNRLISLKNGGRAK